MGTAEMRKGIGKNLTVKKNFRGKIKERKKHVKKCGRGLEMHGKPLTWRFALRNANWGRGTPKGGRRGEE